MNHEHVKKELAFSIPKIPGVVFHHEGERWTVCYKEDRSSGFINGPAIPIPYGFDQAVKSYDDARALCLEHRSWLRKASVEQKRLASVYFLYCLNQKRVKEFQVALDQTQSNLIQLGKELDEICKGVLSYRSEGDSSQSSDSGSSPSPEQKVYRCVRHFSHSNMEHRMMTAFPPVNSSFHDIVPCTCGAWFAGFSK